MSLDIYLQGISHLYFGRLTVTILSTGWGVIGAGVTGIGVVGASTGDIVGLTVETLSTQVLYVCVPSNVKSHLPHSTKPPCAQSLSLSQCCPQLFVGSGDGLMEGDIVGESVLHAPLDATFSGTSLATHAFEYVLKSQPQTGS